MFRRGRQNWLGRRFNGLDRLDSWLFGRRRQLLFGQSGGELFGQIDGLFSRRLGGRVKFAFEPVDGFVERMAFAVDGAFRRGRLHVAQLPEQRLAGAVVYGAAGFRR